jgi:pimeloyl-ACP methyl ester carboxylesterase
MIRPENYLTVNGIRIHYTESGLQWRNHGLRPTLILVHGFAASTETWFDVYDQLASQYHVISVDLKGSGFSDKPDDGKYHVRDQAALLTEFLLMKDVRKIVLVGHSYGGAVSILVYHSLRVRRGGPMICGLVLIDSAGYPQNYPFQVEAYRNPLSRFIMSNFTSATWRAAYGLRRIFMDDSRITADRVRRYAYFYELPGSHQAITQVAAQLDLQDATTITSELYLISVPTLIIWGDSDPVIPSASAKRFADSIPQSRVYFVNAGHVPHEERPDETLAVLIPFLEDLRCEQSSISF